jgi:hypothetical protein
VKLFDDLFIPEKGVYETPRSALIIKVLKVFNINKAKKTIDLRYNIFSKSGLILTNAKVERVKLENIQSWKKVK